LSSCNEDGDRGSSTITSFSPCDEDNDNNEEGSNKVSSSSPYDEKDDRGSTSCVERVSNTATPSSSPCDGDGDGDDSCTK
jgi:hypothetical protein